jgi:predicted nucleotidyltransferase
MDKEIIRTINTFLRSVANVKPDLNSAFLFGSYAKNLQREDSDIDIAIVFDYLDDSNRFNTQVQLMLIAADIDSRIEAHPISKEMLNYNNSFAAEILKTGIKLKKPRRLT